MIQLCLLFIFKGEKASPTAFAPKAQYLDDSHAFEVRLTPASGFACIKKNAEVASHA